MNVHYKNKCFGLVTRVERNNTENNLVQLSDSRRMFETWTYDDTNVLRGRGCRSTHHDDNTSCDSVNSDYIEKCHLFSIKRNSPARRRYDYLDTPSWNTFVKRTSLKHINYEKTWKFQEKRGKDVCASIDTSVCSIFKYMSTLYLYLSWMNSTYLDCTINQRNKIQRDADVTIPWQVVQQLTDRSWELYACYAFDFWRNSMSRSFVSKMSPSSLFWSPEDTAVRWTCVSRFPFFLRNFFVSL